MSPLRTELLSHRVTRRGFLICQNQLCTLAGESARGSSAYSLGCSRYKDDLAGKCLLQGSYLKPVTDLDAKHPGRGVNTDCEGIIGADSAGRVLFARIPNRVHLAGHVIDP